MMFEDDPPPFPSSASGSNKPDVVFADLDDNNRLTAVADDDHFTLDDSDNSCAGAADDVGEITSDRKACSDIENTSLSTSDFVEPRSTVEAKVVQNNCSKKFSDKVSTQSVNNCSGSEATLEVFIGTEAETVHSVLSESPPVLLSTYDVDQHEESKLPLKCLDSLSIEKPACNNEASLYNVDKAFNEKSEFEGPHDFHLLTVNKFDLEDKTNSDDEVVDNVSECINVKTNIFGNCNDSAELNGDADTLVQQDFTNDTDVLNCHESVEEGRIEPEICDVDKSNIEDSDDEFGDFAESCAVAETQNTHIADSSGVEDRTTKSLSQEAAAVEWVADFEDVHLSSSDKRNTLTGNKDDLYMLNDFFNDEFWPSNTLFECATPTATTSDAFDLVEQMNTVLSRKDSLNSFEAVWLAVSIVEEALALKFQWSLSSIYQHFLSSLNIDPKSTAMERTNSLPIFARQLNETTVLQPVSSSIETNKGKWDNPQTNGITAAAANSSVAASSAIRSPVMSNSKIRNVPFDSLAVPPVQFDWNNSGLTNPLSSGSISTSSALLDFGCLTTNDPGLAAGKPGANDLSITLQKDLAALGIEVATTSCESSSSKTNDSNKKPSLFEQIMKSEPTEQHYLSRNELSLDARALHDQLPDLDYMLSNVLLFSVTDR